MKRPFGILREALTHLSWDADEQRHCFAGAAVTDELALDLDAGWTSLPYQTQQAGIALNPELIAGLAALHASFDAPPGDTLWDPASLDSHPTWITARRTAAHLLHMLPEGERLRRSETRAPAARVHVLKRWWSQPVNAPCAPSHVPGFEDDRRALPVERHGDVRCASARVGGGVQEPTDRQVGRGPARSLGRRRPRPRAYGPGERRGLCRSRYGSEPEGGPDVAREVAVG